MTKVFLSLLLSLSASGMAAQTSPRSVPTYFSICDLSSNIIQSFCSATATALHCTALHCAALRCTLQAAHLFPVSSRAVCHTYHKSGKANLMVMLMLIIIIIPLPLFIFSLCNRSFDQGSSSQRQHFPSSVLSLVASH